MQQRDREEKPSNKGETKTGRGRGRGGRGRNTTCEAQKGEAQTGEAQTDESRKGEAQKDHGRGRGRGRGGRGVLKRPAARVPSPEAPAEGSPATEVEIPAQEEQEPAPTQQNKPKKPKKAETGQSQPTKRLSNKQSIQDPAPNPKASKKAKGQEIPDAPGKVSTKAPAEEKPGKSRDQKAAAKEKPSKADQPDQKTTFARRYCPRTEHGSAKWSGLRKTYDSHIAPRLQRPSKFEELNVAV